MASRSYLGNFELMVLLAVIRLDDAAYGVTISRTLEAGTGREISRRGIGWGVSLLFFAGLVFGLPGAASAILEQARAGYVGAAELSAFVADLLVSSAFVVLVDPARWWSRLGDAGGKATALG